METQPCVLTRLISPIDFSLAGLASDGRSRTLTAVFSADKSCTSTVTYAAPTPCLVVKPCLVEDLNVSVGTCDVVSNTYTIKGSLRFSNPPKTGTLTLRDGSVTRTFDAPFTSPLIYTLEGIVSDSLVHRVLAVFSADTSCKRNVTYRAPNPCFQEPCKILSSGLAYI